MKFDGVAVVPTSPARVDRLMRSAIESMSLDLTGIVVLTEAASAHFDVTCLMAGLADADAVIAIVRDSRWGSANDVVAAVRSRAGQLGIEGRIEFAPKVTRSVAAGCSLVTNLGFVRPLGEEMISALPGDAGISLMCEPWEVRFDDVDVGSAIRRSVPVAGTNETHPLVRTFDYLGPLTGQLLTTVGIEVLGSIVLVVASRQFAGPIQDWLIAAGANRVDIEIPPLSKTIHDYPFRCLDAIVIADMGRDTLQLDGFANELPALLARAGAAMVVIAGDVDPVPFQSGGVELIPQDPRPPGHMWVTTSAVGPKPVVDLHCAGLKVGELLVRARRAGSSPDAAVEAAVESGFGLAVSTS